MTKVTLSVAILLLLALSFSRIFNFRIRTLGGDFLRGGPGMRLARLHEGEDGHEDRESDERSVAGNGHAGERFGRRKASATTVHVPTVGTPNNRQESAPDQSDEW